MGVEIEGDGGEGREISWLLLAFFGDSRKILRRCPVTLRLVMVAGMSTQRGPAILSRFDFSLYFFCGLFWKKPGVMIISRDKHVARRQ